MLDHDRYIPGDDCLEKGELHIPHVPSSVPYTVSTVSESGCNCPPKNEFFGENIIRIGPSTSIFTIDQNCTGLRLHPSFDTKKGWDTQSNWLPETSRL